MPKQTLDQIVFRQHIKQAIIPALVFVVFSLIWGVLTLNVVITHEEVLGTVVNTVGPANFEGPTSVSVIVDLDSGRVVSAALPTTSILPPNGARVTLIRYTKRFFGDSFGLK
jgi:hypothetical protein